MPDLDGLLFRKTWISGRPCLVAADLHADEWLERITDDKPLVISARRVRNPRHLAKLWCLLHEVVINTDTWGTEKDLLRDLKEATGLSAVRINPFTGRQYTEVGSISFEAMGQDEFAEWYSRAINILVTHVLQCEAQELIDHINAVLGEDWHPPRRRQHGSAHGRSLAEHEDGSDGPGATSADAGGALEPESGAD